MKLILRIRRGINGHPGNVPLVALILMGAAAGGLGGAAIMTGIFLPIYLLGAYDRARLSDKMARGEE
jgi:hypothetical protein